MLGSGCLLVVVVALISVDLVVVCVILMVVYLRFVVCLVVLEVCSFTVTV